MTTIYVIRTTVKKVEEVWETVSGRKVEDETILDKVFRGWFMTLEGSRESMNLGTEKPDLMAGQKVEITIRPI